MPRSSKSAPYSSRAGSKGPGVTVPFSVLSSASAAVATVSASGSATGMAGGAGDDRLRNAGGLTVKFESKLDTGDKDGDSDVVAIFGSASGDTSTVAGVRPTTGRSRRTIA